MANILFVCLGNICRSPAAEGILRHMVAKNPQFADIEVQSCGLGSWHVGQLPDARMQESARNRGVILSSRAQQFTSEFLDHFDYILAADREVLNALYQFAQTSEEKAKMHLITAFSSSYQGEDVPDPYYGGDASFERVLDMLEDSCEGLLEHLKGK